jgi:hypothetical protein
MSPRRKWDSPNPSLSSECAPPPMHIRLRVRGWGEFQFRRLEKKLSTLPTLWRKATPTLLLLNVSKFYGQCSNYSATVEKKFGL